MDTLNDIITELKWGNLDPIEAHDRVLRLFAVSKRHLLESIIEDMDSKHPEYHREVVENYLDDGC